MEVQPKNVIRGNVRTDLDNLNDCSSISIICPSKANNAFRVDHRGKKLAKNLGAK
jgi:hypothetical protein